MKPPEFWPAHHSKGSKMSLLRKSLPLGLLLAWVFTGAASATTLTSSLNVDNAYEAYISTDDGVAGAIYGSGASWPTTFIQTSAALTPGVVHYLHIKAWDLGPPAALLGQFTLSDSHFAFGNGTQSLLSGSPDLLVSKTGWGGYGPTTDKGANGVGPWGFMPMVDSAARWVWSDTTRSISRR
jgi:MSHA biogenesis protein MshQ